MFKNKKLLAVLLILILPISITACGSSSSSDSSFTQKTIYGKVTAIDGEKITLTIGTVSESQESFSGGNGNKPDNMPSGSQSGDSDSQSGTRPTGTPPNGGSGGDMGGMGGPVNLTLTDKTKTITISDSSIISVQSMGGGKGGFNGPPQDSSSSDSETTTTTTTTTTATTASLSNIKVGSILKVTYKRFGGKLISVVILSDGERPNKSETTTTTAS